MQWDWMAGKVSCGVSLSSVPSAPQLGARPKVPCKNLSPVSDQSWGRLWHVKHPSGAALETALGGRGPMCGAGRPASWLGILTLCKQQVALGPLSAGTPVLEGGCRRRAAPLKRCWEGWEAAAFHPPYGLHCSAGACGRAAAEHGPCGAVLPAAACTSPGLQPLQGLVYKQTETF